MRYTITALIAFLLLFNIQTQAQEFGRALHLLSYPVTEDTRPDVTDGLIATQNNPDDWAAAYVRVVDMYVDGNTANTRWPLTLFIANDGDSLYIAGAVELGNASEQNTLYLYFDQQPRGSLQGSPDQPGEYFVRLQANGAPPIDGHWNGSEWVANEVRAANGYSIRKGSGGSRTYNFEFSMPMNKEGDGANSYLQLEEGDLLNMIPMVIDNGGNVYYWDKTNANITDPGAGDGWAQILTAGKGFVNRQLYSIAANNIIPTIDGNVTGDNNWRFALQRDFTFTDYDGNFIQADFRLKEQYNPDNLFFGIVLKDRIPSPNDAFTIYLDQGENGGDLDYKLSVSGDARFDDAKRIDGGNNFTDLHFDGTNWVQDGTAHGQGAASVQNNHWELEFEVPMSSGDARDLDIQSGDRIGALFHYYDSENDRDYWWSLTINSEKQKIDPEEPIFNALGWGMLQTGAPFVQSIYPQNGDTISGHYPLAVYTFVPEANDPRLGIESVTYQVRLEDRETGRYTIEKTGRLEKIEDEGLPLWTATLNTTDLNLGVNDAVSVAYLVDDGNIVVEIPISVRVDNTAAGINVSDPVAKILSPEPNAEIRGDGIPIDFEAFTVENLSLDTVQVFVNGALLQTYEPGDNSFSGTYLWDSSALPDGDHIIQARAVNNLGIGNFSPVVKVVSNNAPGLAMTAPEASSLHRAEVEVAFEATPVSPNTIAAAEFAVNDGAWVAVDNPPDGSGGSGSHSWNSSTVEDGTHELKIRVTDNTGKTAMTKRSVSTDNTAPSGELVVTPFFAKNTDEVIFRYHAGETGLEAVIPVAELQNLDSEAAGDLVLSDDSQSGIYSASYIISEGNTRDDGGKVVGAVVTDKAGNTYQPQAEAGLINTPPEFVSMDVSGERSIFVNGETIVLDVELDEQGYRLSADFGVMDSQYETGSETVADHGDGTYTIRYTLSQNNTLQGGLYTIEATAVNIVGLTDQITLELTLSTEGPEVTDIYFEETEKYLTAPDYLFVTFADDIDITQAEYYLNVIGMPGEGTTLEAAGGSSFNQTEVTTVVQIDPDALDQGSNTIYVRALNEAGNWGMIGSLSFVVDTKGPEISMVRIYYPEGQQAARQGQEILFTAYIRDETSGLDPETARLTATGVNAEIAGIRMVDDGTEGDGTAGDLVFSLNVKVTSDQTGSDITFHIDAADHAGNESRVESMVRLDNTPPVLQAEISPAPRDINDRLEVYADEILLTGSYFDLPDSSAIRSVVLEIRNEDGFHVNSSPVTIPVNQDLGFRNVLKLVDGPNSIKVHVTDHVGNMITRAWELYYINPNHTEMVGTTGGTVTASDGTTLYLPAGALYHDENITINIVNTFNLPAPSDPNKTLMRKGYAFSPSGLVFNQPVRITLRYTDYDLDINQNGVPDFDEERLSVFYLDGSSWRKIEADEHSLEDRTITFTTNHFSTYAIGETGTVDEFMMYWSKNPFNSDQGSTAVIELRSPGTISLKIYDMSGNLVRVLADDEQVSGTTNRRWDGLNNFNRYVGSGVYIYIFEYTGDDGSRQIIRKPVGVVN